MFCPSCGLEDSQTNQFCRSCGTDMRSVRSAIEKPDSVTASAVSAREEIGRAVATKIREAKSENELERIVSDVLPEVSTFLQSPVEKRLSRMRGGTVTSSIGLGTIIMFVLMFINGSGPPAIMMIGFGTILFLIGLGIMINAYFFTVPKESLIERPGEAANQRRLDEGNPSNDNAQFQFSEKKAFASVTENTTRQLNKKDISFEE